MQPKRNCLVFSSKAELKPVGGPEQGCFARGELVRGACENQEFIQPFFGGLSLLQSAPVDGREYLSCDDCQDGGKATDDGDY